jgi:transposase InsO family protein
MGPFTEGIFISSRVGKRLDENFKYVVTLMDDYSRFAEVILLSRKSEVADAVIGLMKLWERQTERKIKTLRNDQGTEYMGTLSTYCHEHGIKIELSAAYTPQQNGRAERLNRTLMERCRALLSDRQLPKLLWPFAMDTAAYVRNRVTANGLPKTPYEMFYGKKPDISNLRVFGCKTTIYKPAKDRDKLDALSDECVFMGYSRHSKAWRLLEVTDSQAICVVESANVIFQEDGMMSNLQDLWKELDEYNLFHMTEKVGRHDIEQVMNQVPVPQDTDSTQPASSGEFDTPESQQEVPDTADDTDRQDKIVEQERRYPQRNRNPPPDFYQAYLAATGVLPKEPKTFKEATSMPDAYMWRQAANEEFTALRSMEVYETCDFPKGKIALPTKAVLTKKRDDQGNILKYKYRCCVMGCRQLAGRDYDDVFAPTAQSATFRILLSIAASSRMGETSRG